MVAMCLHRCRNFAFFGNFLVRFPGGVVVDMSRLVEAYVKSVEKRLAAATTAEDINFIVIEVRFSFAKIFAVIAVVVRAQSCV